MNEPKNWNFKYGSALGMWPCRVQIVMLIQKLQVNTKQYPSQFDDEKIYEVGSSLVIGPQKYTMPPPMHTHRDIYKIYK